MNDDARSNIHMCKEALATAKQNLADAANEVENSHIKNEIKEQLDQVSSCLESCQKIASGLSQYKNEKKFEGIHH